AAPEAPYAVEYRIKRPDGTERWLEATGRALVDDDGTPVRVVGIGRDVTERRYAQQVGALLADVSLTLATTLDPDEALQQLAARVVPTFADYCVTYAAD